MEGLGGEYSLGRHSRSLLIGALGTAELVAPLLVAVGSAFFDLDVTASLLPVAAGTHSFGCAWLDISGVRIACP